MYSKAYSDMTKVLENPDTLRSISASKINEGGLGSRLQTASISSSLKVEDPTSGLNPAPELIKRMEKYKGYSDNAERSRQDMINRIKKEKGSSEETSEVEGESNGLMTPTGKEDIGKRLMGDISEALGLTDAQAAGIVGNFAHETMDFKFLQEIEPTVPGSKGGRGFAMWTGPRRKQFEAWSKENNLNPDSYEASFGFFIHEVQTTSEGRFIEEIQEAETAEEAARIFSKSYLRPGKPMMSSRVDRANYYIGAQ